MRFETDPGEQAEVDWGNFSYISENGRRRRMLTFVVVLGRNEDGGIQWNSRMLVFARRAGFELRLSRPYRS